MANVSHATLTGSDLHEPKGVATATSGQVYVADGAASGAWTTLSIAGAWTLIATETASASSALNFTGFNSTLYRDYKLVLSNILPATSGDILWLRTSSNGGSSYDSGASDYAWGWAGVSAGAGAVTGNDTADAQIAISRASGNSANQGFFGEINLISPVTAQYCNAIWQVNHIESASSRFTAVTGGGSRLAAADVDAVRLLFSTGNIASGVVQFYGLKL
jgi:hypothetical protein